MNRRWFLRIFGLWLMTPGTGLAVASPLSFTVSPVGRNHLRPPGAVGEESFLAHCIRCGRCLEVCPYHAIVILDIGAGLHAGTPLIAVKNIPCYLCMKCVEVCPTGSLRPVGQKETRMGLAVINRHSCLAWSGEIMCRTCYDKCLFVNTAIRLDQLRPVIDESACTGCGICVATCPVTVADGETAGDKAINIEPIYARRRLT